MTGAKGIKAAQHMEGYLSPEIRAKRIKGALAVIKYNEKFGDVFDAIAYRGASGAITASIIAHTLKKPLILVRKPEDTKGHSPYTVEGPFVVKRYLIVDDFMSTGATYEAIRQAVRKEHPQAECLGMLEVTYCEDGNRDRKYVYSHDHRKEIDRDKRIAEGNAIASDVEWVTRKKPLPAKVVYQPVCIIKDGEKYTFDFENNQQKLLKDDNTPKVELTLGRIFRAMAEALAAANKVPLANRVPLKVDNPVFYYYPIQSDLNTSYEQKTQKDTEAVATAGTAG